MIQGYNRAVDIVKSDTVNFDGSTFSASTLPSPVPCQAIFVGGAGDVIVVFGVDNVAHKFTVLAGTLLPLVAIRVNSTNTTATGMVALYQQ